MYDNSTIQKLIESSYNGCYKSYTLEVLRNHFSEEAANKIWNETVNEYSTLINSLFFSEEDKENALYFILPSVAIYRSTQKFSKENSLELFREIYFKTGYDAHNFLVNKFNEDEQFLKGFPQDFLKTVGEGKYEIIADTPEYTEFHVHQCSFLKIIKQCNCKEICSIFCELDNLMYENLNPHLKFNRDKTIYNGDGICNFSMKYIK